MLTKSPAGVTSRAIGFGESLKGLENVTQSVFLRDTQQVAVSQHPLLNLLLALGTFVPKSGRGHGDTAEPSHGNAIDWGIFITQICSSISQLPDRLCQQGHVGRGDKPLP